MSLEYNKKNIILAKNLLKNATTQEKRLWYGFLSNYEIRFQRQKAIGNYIADFYCHKAKLIIEIDGSQHYNNKCSERDGIRTVALEEYGLKVIRFSNKQIDDDFMTVCRRIDYVIKQRLEDVDSFELN